MTLVPIGDMATHDFEAFVGAKALGVGTGTGFAVVTPDSLLLDDWADGNLTSNREDFDTLEYEGPDPTGRFMPVGERPEWQAAGGRSLPSVSNNRLAVADGEGVAYEAFPNGYNLFENSLNCGFVYYQNTTTSWHFISPCLAAVTNSTGDREFEDSYSFRIREQDGECVFRALQNDSVTSDTINFPDLSDGDHVIVEASPMGDEILFEGYHNGTFIDSIVDDTWEEVFWVGVTSRDADSGVIDIDAYEIYP